MSVTETSERRPFAPEALKESRDGIIDDSELERILEGTWWEHQQRRTSVGVAHVFSRPVTLLESARLDREAFQNHQHTLGTTEARPGLRLHYVVLNNVHRKGLGNLSLIEQQLGGRGRIGRTDFTPVQQASLDHLWRSPEDAAATIGVAQDRSNAIFSGISERLSVNTRWEALAIGLREGFVNPPLEQWRDRWSSVPPSRARVLRVAHQPSQLAADGLQVSKSTVDNQAFKAMRKLGLDTRGELMLAGLANGFYGLEELEVTERKIRLTAHNQRILRLVDREPADAADILGIDRNRIHQVHGSLRRRLGLDSQAQLACWAFRAGYIANEVDPALAEVLDDEERTAVQMDMQPDQDIARQLGVCERTVNLIRAAIKPKVGAVTKLDVVLFGLRSGLIDPVDHLPVRLHA